MKTKSKQYLFVAVLTFFSLSSFLYLNYNLAVKTPVEVAKEISDEKFNESEKILTELVFFKVLGKKLIDIVTFSI